MNHVNLLTSYDRERKFNTLIYNVLSEITTSLFCRCRRRDGQMQKESGGVRVRCSESDGAEGERELNPAAAAT